jgi:hypothetical protein
MKKEHSKMNGAENLYKKRWGVFNHYLYGTVNNPSNPANMGRGETDWSSCTEELDTDLMASQLHEVGAGYLFFTVMQGNKYMAAPNRTYNEIAGTAPGEACSKRDLIADLIRSLDKYGIDLYLYYTGDGPYADEIIGARFGFLPPRKNVSLDFSKKWAAVLEEYALRYKDKVKGWWVDGCYDYFDYTQETLEPYFNAIKAGNSEAAAAFNNGVKETLIKHYKDEDFTCGEFNDFVYIPESRYINGAQAHILAPLGKSTSGSSQGEWCRPGVNRSGEYLNIYVNKVNKAGGAVTIDIPVWRDGRYDPEQLEALKRIAVE